MQRLHAIVSRPESASIALVFGGALWGLFWVPMRLLQGVGLHGAWPGVLVYGATAALLMPLAVKRRDVLRKQLGIIALCGFFTGAAFSLYATSLLLTDIVRAILLFYLTPIWGTILGVMFLGERLTRIRTLALGMGLVGLITVLGIENGLPLPRNAGDVMALISGLCWAYGSLCLYRARVIAVPEQVMGFIFGSLVVGIGLLVIGGQTFGGAVRISELMSAAPWAILAAVYVLPMLVLTLWPSSLLSPGRAGLLLMSEVLVGVFSAALWSGDPFGWRELVGSVLIVGAGFVEVLGQRGAAE